jgi:cob(I)alamin adenosyltransferase
MKIYTKTGDKGDTALLGGARVSKADLRIYAYGTVDELNSYVGLLKDQEVNKNKSELLYQIQNNLFSIGSLLAAQPGKKFSYLPEIKEEDVLILEREMDEMNKILPEMKNFILPGGGQAVSFCHIARCVCRRAEREVVNLSNQEPVEKNLIIYLNRLSDYLFVLSRMMAKELGSEEIIWKGRK